MKIFVGILIPFLVGPGLLSIDLIDVNPISALIEESSLFQRCLFWSEVSFNESLQRYLGAHSTNAKEEWLDTMKHLFEGLNK